MQVAEVILPLPLDKLFHYAVPAEMVGSVRPGVRILVQFGARKEYAAIVTRVLEAPDETELKYLISVLDEHPVVLEHQLLQWSWMVAVGAPNFNRFWINANKKPRKQTTPQWLRCCE